jgi:hypothetical protein
MKPAATVLLLLLLFGCAAQRHVNEWAQRHNRAWEQQCAEKAQTQMVLDKNKQPVGCTNGGHLGPRDDGRNGISTACFPRKTSSCFAHVDYGVKP